MGLFGGIIKTAVNVARIADPVDLGLDALSGGSW